MTEFVEQRLDLGIDYGCVGTLKFNTTIQTYNGLEQRNVNWLEPLGRWQLGERKLLESSLEQINEVTYLQNFHRDRKGSKIGFRFRDWADYFFINYIGDGDDSRVNFQLFKTYQIGSNIVNRPLFKPVDGTVQVFDDNGEITSGWQCNPNNGIVFFDVPPTTGTNIYASCLFDVPVAFEGDEITFKLEGFTSDGEAIYSLGSIFLEEIRIDSIQPIQPIALQNNNNFDVGTILETLISNEFETKKQTNFGGYINKSSRVEESILKVNIGSRKVDKEEIEYLIAWFRTYYGAAIAFNYNNKLVRFEQDVLSFVFDAFEEQEDGKTEAFFEVSGINLIEVKEVTEISQNWNKGFDGNALVTNTFTIDAPPQVQAWGNAEVYLTSGWWDDCGSVGNYSAPCNLGQISTYIGDPIKIGTGLSVTGTVQNLISGGCFLQVSLIWRKT